MGLIQNFCVLFANLRRMSLKTNIISEFRSEPIQATCALVGIFIVIGGFLLAWHHSDPQTRSVYPVNIVQTEKTTLSIPNLLFVVSFSSAVFFTGASTIRILARTYPFHAFILSVVVAPLVAFLSVLVFCMVPPRQISTSAIRDKLLGTQDILWIA